MAAGSIPLLDTATVAGAVGIAVAVAVGVVAVTFLFVVFGLCGDGVPSAAVVYVLLIVFNRPVLLWSFAGGFIFIFIAREKWITR